VLGMSGDKHTRQDKDFLITKELGRYSSKKNFGATIFNYIFALGSYGLFIICKINE
jgi:hypothetical protein